MKFLNSVFAIAALMLVSSVASATVWYPVNTDVDFIQIDLVDTNGGDLALFDDLDFGGTALTIGSAGGHKSMSRAEIPAEKLKERVALDDDKELSRWIIDRIEKSASKK